jgi:hypothetical protein
MPVQRILVPEWRDELAGSRYPFSDDSSLESTSGVKIDKDLFLDAVVYAIGKTAPLYLTSITADYNKVTVTIEDTAQEIGITGEINPFSDSNSIPLFDKYGRSSGLLVLDAERLVRLQGWPLGTTEFGTNAQFVASVVVPLPESFVSGFVLPDGTIVTGDVWFYGDKGVVIRKDSSGNIRFDMVGDPLFRRLLCDVAGTNVELFTTPNFLKTINNLPADEYGNFLITVNTEMANDSILRIYPDVTQNVVKIELVGQKTESVV